MIGSTVEALDESAQAEDIAALVNNPIWQSKVLPKLLEKYRVHLDASTSRDSSPQDRAEHIEAYHLLREFIPWLDKTLRGKDARLREFMNRTGEFK